MAIGRPLDDLSSLPNQWYNEVLELYKKGASDVEVKALIYEWRGSFSNDLWIRWIKDFDVFNDCVIKGRKLSIKTTRKPTKETLLRNKIRRSKRNHKKEYSQNRLAYSLRSLLVYHLRMKGNSESKKTFDLFGYTPSQLVDNISSKLKKGMTLDNYGKWHIDHIKPLSLYDLSKESEIEKAWSFSNLQPLWALDNMIKSNKYE